jgi:hypothetical protein
MDVPSIPTLIASLEDEPLTHLMLGHRELFHSNILAWFFEKFPLAADAVFKPLSQPDRNLIVARTVKREKSNLDLVFEWPNFGPLIIENKVFSLPDEEQLARYAGRSKRMGNAASHWLLSLSDPGWTDGRTNIAGVEWKWIGYSTLAEQIVRALPKNDLTYATETMRHYARVIQLLSELARQTTVSSVDDHVNFEKSVIEKFKGSRLLTSFGKIRSACVAKMVSEALRQHGFHDLTVKSDFSNQNPLLEVFQPVPLGTGALAGWQLQGDQFRRAVILPHLEGRTEESLRRRFEVARENMQFFDFAPIDEILGTVGKHTEPVKKEFGKFDPAFVHRYKRAPSLTVAKLAAAAVQIAFTLSPPRVVPREPDQNLTEHISV